MIVKAETLGFKLQKGSPEVADHPGGSEAAGERRLRVRVRRGVVRAAHPQMPRAAPAALRSAGVPLLLPPFAAMAPCNKCEATVKLSVGDVKEYTVEEGDGPVNALDAALRKALRPFYPGIDADRPRRLQSAHHQRPARHRRQNPRPHRLHRRSQKPGAPSASATTSSKPAGSPWWTRLSINCAGLRTRGRVR